MNLSFSSVMDVINVFQLATVIWLEARGEDFKGRLAVGYVVRNRVTISSRYGGTYNAIIFQPKQFSALNPDDPNYEKAIDPIKWDKAAFYECFDVALAVYGGTLPDPTDGADHYHHKDIRPSWVDEPGMVKTLEHGNHIFYRSRAVTR